jgi:outer membrane cobalamin receptor
MYRLLLLLFITKIGYSQTIIKGEVIDGQTSETLIGANILIKGAKTGTATDYNGNFTLETTKLLPLTLEITYLGYKNKEVLIEQSNNIKIKLFPNNKRLNEVKIVDSRITQKQKESALTVEALDIIAIKSSPSANFYDALGSLKGVDISSASLGFKVINTRGFNSTSPVRSLQIIDGVDNQAPGLNFSLGNFLGASELDIMKVEIIQGANSAYYGPSAFNGVISMNTRSPFMNPGLSVQYKFGSRQLFENSFRFADVIKNKNGEDKFGYKINFSYMQAFDWEANNLSPVEASPIAINPGGYDAVNIYGDEDLTGSINDYETETNNKYYTGEGLGIFHRTGYLEKDVVDYNTKNLKFATAFHYKIQEDFELIYSMNYGTGTTVYQGDNRFSLNGIQFLQNRIELNKKDKFFIRAYRSQEDAGDSYDAVATAVRLQDYNTISPNDWFSDYSSRFIQNFNFEMVGWSSPTPLIVFDPINGLQNNGWVFQLDTFDINWMTNWYTMSDSVLNANTDLIISTHQDARDWADSQSNVLVPGTPEFEAVFNDITSKISYLEGGTGFYDKSSLNHIHSEYQFGNNNSNIKIGANFRQYTPDSKGSIFMDTVSKIINNEFGIYTGAEIKLLGEALKINTTVRADKNENFDVNLSPAASIVYKPNKDDVFRLSFGSALRNPTLSDQYLFYNVGRAILIGNLYGHGTDYGENLVTIESLYEYFTPTFPIYDSLRFFSVVPIKPEKTKSIELGYRSTISSKIYVDANFYYSEYTNFIGYKIGAKFQADTTNGGYSIALPSIQAYRMAANAENKVTTKGASIGINYYPNSDLSISGNYSWNSLNEKGTNDPIIPAYNTPEHKFNLGLLMKNIHFSEQRSILRDFSSSLTYKWIEGYNYEGSPQFTGSIPTYDILDFQVSKKIPEIDATLKIGSTNILNNLHYEVYGGPYIGRMTYCSILFDIK